MPKRKTSKITLIVTACILSVIALAFWDLVFPHKYEPSHVDAANFRTMTSVRVPPEAHDFRLATFHHFQQTLEYGRFEAPPDVCLKYAANFVVSGTKLVPVDEVELTSDARPIRRDAFRDFSWFDLANAKNVVGGGGGPMTPKVWVDQIRGVFYYRLTD